MRLAVWSAAAGVAILLLGAKTRTVTLHFAAINDFHGALYERPVPGHPDRATGGLPWLVSAVESLRREHPDLLLLDGGDSFQGDWPVNAGKGAGSLRAFDLLGVDFTAIGNHEFDYGAGPLDPKRGVLEAAAKTRNQWLSANIYRKDGSPWLPEGVRPWAIAERSGVKIGVIGLTTTETPTTTMRSNVDDLEFKDVVATVAAVAPQVRAAGAQVVVVVGHLSGACEPRSYFDQGPQCMPDGEIGRLLTELPEGTIDVLVAGHAHTVLAERVGRTFVLEDRAYGHAIGRLDLVVGKHGVDVESSVLSAPWGLEHAAVAPPCPSGPFPTTALAVGGRELIPDARAITLIDELERAGGGRETPCARVGCATAALNRNADEESALGDFVADALLSAYPGADIAVQNSGGLRADLAKGDIHQLDVEAVLPFNNQLMLVELSGAQVQEMLRIGGSGAHGVLQVAGAAYTIDPARQGGADRDGNGAVDRWERDRVCAMTVGGESINPAKTYRVVTSDFLFKGGDDMKAVFAGAPVVGQGELLRTVVTKRIAAEASCVVPSDLHQARVRIASCP